MRGVAFLAAAFGAAKLELVGWTVVRPCAGATLATVAGVAARLPFQRVSQ